MGFLGVLGSAAASGLGGLVTGLFNTFTGQAQSKDLMRYQYQLQQKGIEDQRAYNSPEQQMKRLAKAALNPNLVYGHGVDGNQSSAASAGIVNRSGQMDNPLQDAVQQYNIERQLQLQEIKTRNDAFESRERQLKLRAETLGQLLDNRYNSKTMEDRIKILSQRLVNDMQQQKNLEANEALTWSRTRNEDNRLAEIWANVDLLKARKNLTDEQALTETVRRGAIAAGIELTEAQIGQVAQYVENLQATEENTEAGTALRRQEKRHKETTFQSTSALKKWLANHPRVQMSKDILESVLDRISGLGALYKAIK